MRGNESRAFLNTSDYPIRQFCVYLSKNDLKIQFVQFALVRSA